MRKDEGSVINQWFEIVLDTPNYQDSTEEYFQ